MTEAKVVQYNGSPALMINGKPYPPMTMTTECADREYLRKIGESGIKIFYVVASMDWTQPGDPEFQKAERQWAWFIRPDMSRPGTEIFLEDARILLEAVPDAWIILRLNVSPSVEWINSHPEEQVRYSDGQKHPVLCTSASRYDEVDNMHSLCSQRWREEADEAMHAFFDMLEGTEIFERVIGVFLCAAGTSEWYYPNPLVQPDGAYADFSEPFRRTYENFLRRKYKTVENLRKAWNNPQATFENPPVPTPEERFYVAQADKAIHKDMWEWKKKKAGSEEYAEKNCHNDGVFLNMNRCAHPADFFQAWHAGTAETIIHFSRTVKNRYPNWVVGAFYGSYGCTDYYQSSTTTGTPEILDCGTVDFLAAPGTYNNREPGGIVAMREMQDSFRLRGRIFVSEDDSRTHRTLPLVQRWGHRLYTAQDSVNTLKRDFARNICEDIQAWWFDMGGDWYNDPDILEMFKRQQEVAHFAYSLDRTKKNEIALIYDTESVHMVGETVSKLTTDFYRTSDLGCIGAPVDYYFHDDLTREDMPDYRMYIMINQYCLTEEEREAVMRKARRNRALVLWLYAPGFIQPGGETVMDTANIEKTVGMHVVRAEGTQEPYFHVEPSDHPALHGAHASRRYGTPGRDVHSNAFLDSGFPRHFYLNPAFYIEDEETVTLGRSLSTGKTMLAMTEKDGFTSVYCTAQVLGCDMLMSLAEYAGCHIYSRDEDVLYANENFVAIHASSDGRKTIRFKKPCSPYEVYEKKSYGENVASIEVDMKLGDTLMWYLNGEC